MSIISFFKGKKQLKLPKNKEHTRDKPIVSIKPLEGEKFNFLLSQHKGAPAKALVKKGDRVLSGQIIAEGSAKISAHVHSSISGSVLSVDDRSIIIENDGLDEEVEFIKREDFLNLSKEEIIKLVKDAAIVGWGGAGFPTHIKLSPPSNHKIDTIIINGAECEPYIVSDFRAMMEKTSEIIGGVKILEKLFPNANIFIAIEDDNPEAIELFKKRVEKEPKISIKILSSTYPMGSEKQLIETCTGRQVPSGRLPSEIGCIVINISSTMSVYEAIANSKPHNYRIVTLSGKVFNNPGAYKVPIGMPLSAIVEKIGGYTEEPAKLIDGGTMMGRGLFSLDTPIIKTTSGILGFSKKDAELPEEDPCIRCSKCVEYCPVGLMPFQLNILSIADDRAKFEQEFSGMDCIECGCCSFICPSKRHLAESIILTKRKITNAAAEEAANREEEMLLQEAMKEISININ